VIGAYARHALRHALRHVLRDVFRHAIRCARRADRAARLAWRDYRTFGGEYDQARESVASLHVWPSRDDHH
jgi:hypothetical protein